MDASGVLATLAAPPPGILEFNNGYLHSSLQPERALSAALARAGRRPGAWGRPPVEGLPELRAWFAREIGGPGGTLGAADVLITAGGQSALTCALRALAPPGAPVLVESPTYPGVLAAARASGLRPVPVPVDAEGVRPELLAEALRATGARVFVCQPLFQNPTGAMLAPERRREVIRIAREAGAFVVEDDFAHAARPRGRAPAVRHARRRRPRRGGGPCVLAHQGHLAESAGGCARRPRPRAGAAARDPGRRQLLRAPPAPGGRPGTGRRPSWPRHLRNVAAELRTRREALVTAVRRELPALELRYVPPGGYHLWLRLPQGADETALDSAALRAGVAVAPGGPYFCAEPPAPHVRLSFASVAGVGELAEGVRRLRTAWGEVLGRA